MCSKCSLLVLQDLFVPHERAAAAIAFCQRWLSQPPCAVWLWPVCGADTPALLAPNGHIGKDIVNLASMVNVVSIVSTVSTVCIVSSEYSEYSEYREYSEYMSSEKSEYSEYSEYSE